MSERISIPELCERARRAVEFPPSWMDERPSPQDTLALVEAVEASRVYVDARGVAFDRNGRHFVTLQIDREALETATLALARFDFGDPA